MMIKGFLALPKEQREFLKEYLDMINSFQFNVETYRGKKDDLPIQNTDLWIESYIDFIPDLQEFRNYVRSEMARLGIEKHPFYTYRKEFNHYYYSNKRDVEELEKSISFSQSASRGRTSDMDLMGDMKPDAY